MFTFKTTNLGKFEAEVAKAKLLLSGKEIKEKLVRAVDQVSEFTAERAAANAPILKGPLRASMTTQKAIVKGNTIEGAVLNTSPYALKQHEELGPRDINPSGWMNLGPISVQQPTTPEGGVGGKYIERVVQFHLSRYQEFIKDALKK